MDKIRAQKLLAARKAKAPPPFKIEDILFKEQLAFVTDPARYATAVTSTRAGKTMSCAVDLLNTSQVMPGTTGLYITLARSSAKRIVWPTLLKLNAKYQLKGVPNLAELSIAFPNGSMIYCGGANTESEIEKYRGLSDVALVYTDESQAFRQYIRELIEEIVAKRLYDTNGRCRMIGTPGLIPTGYFYEASRSKAWSHHHWSLHQNPFMFKKSGLTPEQLVAQDCARKGVALDHPSIQRECFGLWAQDDSSLILTYSAPTNNFEALPPRVWHHVMGIDVGFIDADAIAVLAYSDEGPETYLVHEEIVAKQDLSSLAEKVKRLQHHYEVNRSVIDEGGLGKKLAEEMRVRWALPIEPAEKTRKMENLAILNDALRSGRFRAKQESRFASDCMQLEIDREKSRPDKTVVSSKFHSDIIDSVLYAFKLSPAYSFAPKEKEPVKGSKEWFLKQNQIDWEAERERLLKNEQGEDTAWPKTDADWSRHG